MWDRVGARLPPDPRPGDVPRATPDPARPRAGPGEIRITFVGHATLLIQAGGLNFLTDPVWSRRAGPTSFLGGRRFSEPGMALDDLPPLDGVLLTHGHYDHLDRPTVHALRDRFGPDLPWYTPLGYGPWLARRGMTRTVELDWWHEVRLERRHRGPVRLVCLPVRHWTRRGLRANRELWCSWAVLEPGQHRDGQPRGVFFAGDSGWCPAFREIGQRLGPFRTTLLPIGAYEPRWFMAPAHMNPEEAVRAYLDLGGRGLFVGMHWGAFRLTDEDPLEPPVRARRAWNAADLPPENLGLPGLGETLKVPSGH